MNKLEKALFRATIDCLQGNIEGLTINKNGTVNKLKNGYVVTTACDNVTLNTTIKDINNKVMTASNRASGVVGVFSFGNGTVSIDNNIILKSRKQAMALGIKNNQNSIYNLSNGECIPCGGNGKANVYSN